MKSKERVLLSFEHTEPDRVPLWYGASDNLTEKLCGFTGSADTEQLLEMFHIDFRRVSEKYIGPVPKTYEDGRSESYWGIVRGGIEYGQPLSHPLAGAELIRDIEGYDWPDPEWFSVEHCRNKCVQWSDYAVIGGPWVVVWTDTTELMGMPEYLTKMLTHPEVIHALNKKVADYYWQRAVKFFDECGDLLDIFFFGDDFGTQETLFVSQEQWRIFFKPIIKRFSDLGHDYGMKTMFHSCGSVNEIIPDLIDVGIDALNPVQIRAAGMDPAILKKEYGDRLTFHGAIDHQRILPFGIPDEVRREVRKILDIMAPGGGYCLAASHDLMLADFPAENVFSMYDEAYNYGKYK